MRLHGALARWLLTVALVLSSFAVATTTAYAYTEEGCWWPQNYVNNLSVSGSFGLTKDATAFWDSTNDWTATPTKVIMFQASASSNPDITGIDGNYGASGWIGQTSYGCWPILGNFYVPVQIQMNTYYTGGYTVDHIRANTGHELGHALGLGHSNMCPAIMNPVDTYITCGIYLPQQDDINGVNAIYGAP